MTQMKAIVNATPTPFRPEVFLFLGGTGNDVRRELNALYHAHGINMDADELHRPLQYRAIDSDPRDIADAPESRRILLRPEDFVRSMEFQSRPREWFSPHIRYQEVRNGAGMFRQVGTGMFMNQANKVREQLRMIKEQIAAFDLFSRDTPINFHLIGSVAGGTGAGSMIPLAFEVRRAFMELRPVIHGHMASPFFFMNGRVDEGQHPQLAINGVATMTEMDRFTFAKKFSHHAFDGRKLEVNGYNVLDHYWYISPEGEEGNHLTYEEMTSMMAWTLFFDTLGWLTPEASTVSNITAKRFSVGQAHVIDPAKRGQEIGRNEHPQYGRLFSSRGFYKVDVPYEAPPQDAAPNPAMAMALLQNMRGFHNDGNPQPVMGRLETDLTATTIDTFVRSLVTKQEPLLRTYADTPSTYIDDLRRWQRQVIEIVEGDEEPETDSDEELSYYLQSKVALDNILRRLKDNVRQQIHLAVRSQGLDTALRLIQEMMDLIEAQKTELMEDMSKLDFDDKKDSMGTLVDELRVACSNIKSGLAILGAWLINSGNGVQEAEDARRSARQAVKDYLEDGYTHHIQKVILETYQHLLTVFIPELRDDCQTLLDSLKDGMAVEAEHNPMDDINGAHTEEVLRRIGQPLLHQNMAEFNRVVWDTSMRYTLDLDEARYRDEYEIWVNRDFANIARRDVEEQLGIIARRSSPYASYNDAPFSDRSHSPVGIIFCTREVWERIKPLVSPPFGSDENWIEIDDPTVILAYQSTHLMGLGAIEEMRRLRELANSYTGGGGIGSFLSDRRWANPVNDTGIHVPPLEVPPLIDEMEPSTGDLEKQRQELETKVTRLRESLQTADEAKAEAIQRELEVAEDQAAALAEAAKAAQAKAEALKAQTTGDEVPAVDYTKGTPNLRFRKTKA